MENVGEILHRLEALNQQVKSLDASQVEEGEARDILSRASQLVDNTLDLWEKVEPK